MSVEAGGAVSQLAGLCLPHVPRVLALMDRDVLSPTYGSMDRAYWYYRTLTNFPGAVWQQPMVGLAAVARAAHASNPLAGDPRLLEAARAALLAWSRAQHGDGAFDEWYRNEHSYCPTAFTAAGAAITLQLLARDIDAGARDEVLAALRRAGQWLVPRFNAEVMNQNLAAAAALAGLARLDGDARWREPAVRLLQRIAGEQSAEGWFPEYGGFDFGYSLLALDLLAVSDRFGLADVTTPMADRLVTFLTRVLDVECAVPGRLGSRGTAHAFLFGAFAFAARLPGARSVTDVLLRVHASGVAAGPAGYDDRYFAYFAFPQYCLAYHAAVSGVVAAAPAPAALPPHVDLRDSGLAVWRGSGATVVVNRRLGGAAALLRAGAPALYHLGYTVDVGARRYSSAGWHPGRTLTDIGADRAIAAFTAVSGGIPLRRLTIPFQLAVHALVSGRLAEAFHSIVKRRMIHSARQIPLTLERQVTVDGARLLVNDVLRPGRRITVDRVAVTDQPTMHSPSARQDGSMSLALGAVEASAVRDALRAGRPVTVQWTIGLDTGQARAQVTG